MAKIKPTFTKLPSDWKEPTEIKLRAEQERFIEKTQKYFSSLSPKELSDPESAKRRQFLWNAKMRFGKTLCALELVRRMGIKRTLIITHRPTLKDQWFEDFQKIFSPETTVAKFGYRLDNESAKDSEFKRSKGISEFDKLEEFASKSDNNTIVFFASMQYLRRSRLVGGDDVSAKKAAILNAPWDLVIIDEAHEGTNTVPGQNVKDYLARPNTLRLELSGTPFNISENFESKQIESWDYVQEQHAKMNWDELHPGEQNPYFTLPRMNIMRYDLGAIIDKYVEKDENGHNREFKFTEFFRVEEGTDNPRAGLFVHEDDVKEFIRKLRKKDDNNYPFSNDEFRRAFAHTLWIVPRVDAARALEKLLRKDDVFKKFQIINVAGKNDDDETSDDALERVKKAIDPKESTQPAEKSITISCGRLTTGVTVRQWTAVLYMKGSEMTSTATYLQTIFRVQSPYVYTDNNGRKWMKSECYAFDFAPTRALNVVAETAIFNTNIENKKSESTKGKTRKEVEKAQSMDHIRAFLKYCDVMSLDEARLTPVDADRIFEQLNEVYIDRIVRNGFDDRRLFNLDEIDKMSSEERNALGEDSKWLADATRGDVQKPNKKTPLDLIQLADDQQVALESAKTKVVEYPDYEDWWTALTDLERTMAALYLQFNGHSIHPGAPKEEDSKTTKGKKEKPEKTPEEKEQEKLRKEQEKERMSIISVLKSVMVRIPLLIYGAELNGKYKDITIDNITEIVDDDSWREFMPKKDGKEIDKKWFKKYKKYIHEEFFRMAGRKYRRLAEEADDMHTEDRIARITELFKSFRNPDKETVLTPWPVVNMHMAETLGGYCFYNQGFDALNTVEHEETINGVKAKMDTVAPRLIPPTEISEVCFNNIDELGGESRSRILEINSKSGLYPLYVAYSIYRPLLDIWKKLCENPENTSVKEEQAIWDQVLRQNVFVVCKTAMARSITCRTLRGYRRQKNGVLVQVNAVYPEWTVRNVKDRHEGKFSTKAKQIIENARKGKLDLVDILRVDSKIFEEDVLNPEWWENVDKGNRLKFTEKLREMKKLRFDAVVGNPPYQGEARVQLYPDFYLTSRNIGGIVSMIFPISWQRPCAPTAKGLAKLNTEDIKRDHQIILIDNRTGIFEDVPGANEVNFILWQKNYDNKLDGKQLIYHNGKNENHVYLNTEFTYDGKPEEIVTLYEYVRDDVDKNGSVTELISSKDPFHLPTNLFTHYSGAGLPEPTINCQKDTDVRVFGLESKIRKVRFMDISGLNAHGKELLNQYKVFVPWAWGNMAKNTGLGGSYASILIAKPKDVCTMTYNTCGPFNSEREAICQAKYMLTKFFRALLYLNKNVKTASKESYRAIPQQTFTEEWWEEDISTINEELLKKYEVPKEVRIYINEHIQDRDESFIERI